MKIDVDAFRHYLDRMRELQAVWLAFDLEAPLATYEERSARTAACVAAGEAYRQAAENLALSVAAVVERTERLSRSGASLDERAAFEQWAVSQGSNVTTDGADYYLNSTSLLWAAWQARAAFLI